MKIELFNFTVEIKRSKKVILKMENPPPTEKLLLIPGDFVSFEMFENYNSKYSKMFTGEVLHCNGKRAKVKYLDKEKGKKIIHTLTADIIRFMKLDKFANITT